MKTMARSIWLVAILSLSLFAWVGCGEDEGPTGGPVDTTPPSVVEALALDATHIQLVFSEDVTPASAERTDNYTISLVGFAESSAGSDASTDGDASTAARLPAQSSIASAALVSGNVVLLATGEAMGNSAYNLVVRRVSDVNGNVMTDASTTEFAGTSEPDLTAPTIVTVTPKPAATGVGTSQPVFVEFSEPMQDFSVVAAFSWTSSKGAVRFATLMLEVNYFEFVPLAPLERNLTYRVTLTSAAQDWTGNHLADSTWTFRTMTTADVTPPSLTSSVPANGARNVATDAALKLTFSEPIKPLSKQVVITPALSRGTEEWSNGNRILSFTPDEPLLENTQYLLILPDGSIEDLSGNTNTEFFAIQFTTGSSFAAGRVQGTLAGDAYSVQAADPTGALVAATTIPIFGGGDDMTVFGAGSVNANDSYSIDRLPDAAYYPFAIMDSNDDGLLDIERGDAIGAYGVDIRSNDLQQAAAYVQDGGTVAGIDFPLYDPVAIAGIVLYDGTVYVNDLTTYRFFVGAFDTATFDPQNPPDPDAGAEGGPLAWDPNYLINSLDTGLPPGTYYIGAYLDVNFTGSYEPTVDPAGFYRNLSTGVLYPVNVENGTDALAIAIHIDDPSAGASLPSSSAWRSQHEKKSKDLSASEIQSRIDKILRSMERSSR